MLANNIPKRPKPPTIKTVDEIAPWILVAKASAETGLTELLIRKSGVRLRRFGNADYVRPRELNDWINDEGKEETLP